MNFKIKTLKIISITILVTYFSCYVSLAAEMGASNYTKLTDNIVAWKNIDNADIVLSNGQDISNIATKKSVEIQEQEEVVEVIESNKIDLCLLVDCSESMKYEAGNTTRMDKLKKSAKDLIESLSKDCQLRVTLINFGEIFHDANVNKADFIDNRNFR